MSRFYKKNRDRDEMLTVPLPQIEATIAVKTPSGTYYISCARCNGHPIVGQSYMPLKPIRFAEDFADIKGYTGGWLPIFPKGQGSIALACSCDIGTYRMRTAHTKRYDEIPGTNSNDTLQSIMRAERQRIIEDLKEQHNTTQ